MNSDTSLKLKRSADAKSLLNNEEFKSAINFVYDGIESAMLNCKFDKPGDADKLILSKILLNRMVKAIRHQVSLGEHEEHQLEKQLLKERKEHEYKDPVFNRDAGS